jgi:hypothetical protein
MTTETPTQVWVVICVSPGKSDVTHIFSTMEKAETFCEKDSRDHVVYDYILDTPERHEGLTQ